MRTCALQENVLAAERPPDAPPQEVGGATSQEVGGATSQEVGGAASQGVGGAEGVLTKDNFLLATFDPWKGKHSDVASSENDVLLLDESTATPPVPDWTDDLGAGSFEGDILWCFPNM